MEIKDQEMDPHWPLTLNIYEAHFLYSYLNKME